MTVSLDLNWAFRFLIVEVITTGLVLREGKLLLLMQTLFCDEKMYSFSFFSRSKSFLFLFYEISVLSTETKILIFKPTCYHRVVFFRVQKIWQNGVSNFRSDVILLFFFFHAIFIHCRWAVFSWIWFLFLDTLSLIYFLFLCNFLLGKIEGLCFNNEERRDTTINRYFRITCSMERIKLMRKKIRRKNIDAVHIKIW